MRAGMGDRINAINSTEVLIVTTGRLTGPIAGVTRLPLGTADRGMRAGIIVDAVNGTEVPIVTAWRRRWLTGPIAGVT